MLNEVGMNVEDKYSSRSKSFLKYGRIHILIGLEKMVKGLKKGEINVGQRNWPC
jgi:hypothetical protein